MSMHSNNNLRPRWAAILSASKTRALGGGLLRGPFRGWLRFLQQCEERRGQRRRGQRRWALRRSLRGPHRRRARRRKLQVRHARRLRRRRGGACRRRRSPERHLSARLLLALLEECNPDPQQ